MGRSLHPEQELQTPAAKAEVKNTDIFGYGCKYAYHSLFKACLNVCFMGCNLNISMIDSPCILCFLFSLVLSLVLSFSVPFTPSTAGTQSITNYFMPLSTCTCDLTALCDNYCCCDADCTASVVSGWAGMCLTQPSTAVESLCETGTSTSIFTNIACVYYTNRGSIGSYYPQISSSQIPIPNLFSYINTQINTVSYAAQAIPYTLSNPYLTYSAGGAYGKILLPRPMNGVCGNTPLNITELGVANFASTSTSALYSTTTTCQTAVTAANCASLNSFLPNGAICLTGSCSTTVPINSVSPSATTTCNGVYTTITVSYTLSSHNELVLSSFSLTPTPTNPALNSYVDVTVKVLVTVQSPYVSVGNKNNPGFTVGGAVPVSLSSIVDANQNCVTAGVAAGTTPVNLRFLQPFTTTCAQTLLCSPTYLDTLATMGLQFPKYATWQSEKVSMISALNSTCNSQGVVINIVYSKVGWLGNPQYYIAGAYLSGEDFGNANKLDRYLSVRWVYMDASAVSVPPSNSFYTYFSYLWEPLRSQFGLK